MRPLLSCNGKRYVCPPTWDFEPQDKGYHLQVNRRRHTVCRSLDQWRQDKAKDMKLIERVKGDPPGPGQFKTWDKTRLIIEEGLTNKQIAERLNISQRSVERWDWCQQQQHPQQGRAWGTNLSQQSKKRDKCGYTRYWWWLCECEAEKLLSYALTARLVWLDSPCLK